MADNAQPLNSRIPIINKDGTPTEYFIRWAQQFSKNSDFSSLQDEVDNLSLSSLNDVDITTNPPTNNQALTYDLGSQLWVPESISGGGSWRVAPPPASDFSTIVKDAGISPLTIEDAPFGSGLFITSDLDGTATQASARIYKTMPDPPFRLEVMLHIPLNTTNNYYFAGIGMGYSGNQRCVNLTAYFDGGNYRKVYYARKTDSVSHAGANVSILNSTPNPITTESNYWMALEYEGPGNNVKLYASFDGYCWFLLGEEPDTYFLDTPDQIGFFWHVAASSGTAYWFCPHWEVKLPSDLFGLNT